MYTQTPAPLLLTEPSSLCNRTLNRCTWVSWFGKTIEGRGGLPRCRRSLCWMPSFCLTTIPDDLEHFLECRTSEYPSIAVIIAMPCHRPVTPVHLNPGGLFIPSEYFAQTINVMIKFTRNTFTYRWTYRRNTLNKLDKQHSYNATNSQKNKQSPSSHAWIAAAPHSRKFNVSLYCEG